MEENSSLYDIKNESYYKNVRRDILELIPNQHGIKVLEVGCGKGATLSYLKEKDSNNHCVGTDILMESNPTLDNYVSGNVETMNLDLLGNGFDYILCLDVLEHLSNPQKVLKNIVPLLNSNGKIIISLPNIRHYYGIINIFLKGDFKRDKEGLFDETHVGWYCLKNMKDLVNDAGLDILQVASPINSAIRDKNKKVGIFNRLTLGFFSEFLSSQYYLVCKPN